MGNEKEGKTQAFLVTCEKATKAKQHRTAEEIGGRVDLPMVPGVAPRN